MRKIPTKNYIILVVIGIITIFILGYFSYWYQTTTRHKESESVLSGYLLDIGEDELSTNLSNYLIDNPNILLYVTFGTSAYMNNFELEFKDYIASNKIKSNFLFIDLNTIKNKNFLFDLKEQFFSVDLKNKYFKLDNQANLFVFENGKIIKTLYYGNQKINMHDVDKFLKDQGVVTND